MNYDFDKIELTQKYHLMIQTIIPRPIAWTLTRNESQSLNLAPFSYFNAICTEPPLLMLSIGHKKDGSRKDTWRNIEREKEFVIHIPSVELAGEVTKSSLELPYDESEIDLTGLETQRLFEKSDLPRLAKAKVAYLCRHYQTTELGPRKQGLIFGEILELFVVDKIVMLENSRPKINAKGIDPLGRLGGNDYGNIGEIITVPRPDYTPT